MMALAVFVLVLGSLLLYGLCEVRSAFEASARLRQQLSAAELARRMQPVQFKPAPIVWYDEPKEPRRTLRPSDCSMFAYPPASVRIKRRREELTERRRMQAEEQARFMDVFKLTREDYA
jgi:hypothetical protein